MATVADHGSALILDANDRPTWRYRQEPFQRAFQESGLSAREVEARAGLVDGHLRRLLGLRPWKACSGGATRVNWSTSVSYANAVKVARALDMDLPELGL